METVELALELRRAGYGANGERLGFDLYPYTEDQVAAVRRSVEQWRFIDEVARPIDDAALREAQARKDAVAAYELVYAALGARARDDAPGRARRRHVVGQGRSRSTATARVARASPSAAIALSTPRPGWSEQDPEDWWRGERRGARRARRGEPRPASGCRGRCTGSSRSTPTIARCARRSSGTTAARSAQCDEIEAARRLRAARRADGQPRAGRVHRAQAAVAARATSPRSSRASRRILLPKDYVRLRLCGEHAIDVADASGTLLFDVARRALERRGRSTRSSSTRRGCRGCSSRPQVCGGPPAACPSPPARATRPPGRSASASWPRAGRRRSCSAPPASSSRRSTRYAPRPAGARARLLPRGARRLARDGRDAQRGGVAAVAARIGRRRSYDELVAEAGGWAPGARGPALPALPGRRAHAPRRPATRAAPSPASSLRHDRGALVRAVLEGVAFGLRDSLDLVAELGERPARRPRLGRRRAQRSCGCEIVASVLELPLERVAVDEGAAFGAALLGGRRRRRVAGRPRCRRGVREGHARRRAARGVGRALRGDRPAVPRALSRVAAVAGVASS